MADITTRLSVTGIAQYKAAMKEAQSSVKTLDQELKRNEAQFKATGDKEQYMSQKSQLLEQKLKSQKTVIQQAQAALKQLQQNGVQPTDAAYQRMQQQLVTAQTAMYNTTAEINNLSGAQQTAASSADQLTASVNGISKKVSLDAVIGGIDKITTGLESAAKKAVQLGETIWNEIMDSAQWADDTATQAMINGMSIDEYQRVKNVADTWGETSVEAIMAARKRVQKNLSDMSDDVKDTLGSLGVSPYEVMGGKYGETGELRDWESIFWDVGDALLHMEDGYKREEYAQQIFGRKWDELIPMFQMGRDAYQEALDSQDTVSEDSVQSLAELNDTVTQVQQKFETLKNEVIGQVAPAFTAAADVISQLLGNLNEFLKTEEGQQMLDNLSTTVSGLFEDLATIDPAQVVDGFVGVFNTIVDGLEWLVDNKDSVIGALKGIVIGWAGLKLTGGALQVLQLVNGVKGFSLSGTGLVEGGGAAAGAAGGGHFFSNLLAGAAKAAPWLAGAAVLLTPSGGDAEESDLYHADGTPTRAGRRLGLKGQGLDDGYDLYGKGHLSEIFGEEAFPVTVEPEAAPDAADQIAAQVGTVTIPVRLDTPPGWGGGFTAGTEAFMHANGLNFVPWDGYPAILHKGEQIVSAREAASRSFSSNLYVESMYMNNGMDAAGLAQAIAARNQRAMAGFGS